MTQTDPQFQPLDEIDRYMLAHGWQMTVVKGEIVYVHDGTVKMSKQTARLWYEKDDEPVRF